MRLRFLVVLLLLLAVVVGSVAGIVTQPFAAEEASTPPDVDPSKLKSHVRYLSEDLYPRSFEQFRNIEHSAQYIRTELEKIGADVSVQEVTVQESTYKNIIARFGPASGSLMVIGAHYDSYGDTIGGAAFPGGYHSSTHTPGADDNASGVAGLIELARLLQQNPPSYPVELVAYTLEEPPHFRTQHMGSAWHARALNASKRDIRLMLSLEMIGYFTDAPDSQRFPVAAMEPLYPSTGNFIALVGRVGDFAATRRAKSLMSGASDLPVYSINAPSLIPGIDFSDHLNYWSEGYPALMVTDTAFYRNSNYHKSGDTYEKLDYQRMAKVVQGVYAIVHNY